MNQAMLIALGQALVDFGRRLEAIAENVAPLPEPAPPPPPPTTPEEAKAADTPRPSFKQWQETQPAPRLEVPIDSMPKPRPPRPPVMRRGTPP